MNYKNPIFALAWDFRFWIVVFFAIRLENWDLPPLDANALRQFDAFSCTQFFGSFERSAAAAC